MELYTIPFEGEHIVYRPLRRLAFVANRAMIAYIEQRLAGAEPEPGSEAEAFLAAVRFWEPDPPPPPPCRLPERHEPTICTLLMTSACNLRCTYCYAHGGEGPVQAMPAELARRAIDVAGDNALRRGRSHFQLCFHGGGEPTLNWPVLREAVEYARAKPLRCEISMASNGLWSDVQREFILSHFDSISLSFDGVREVQDRQRPRADGSGSFDAVWETIRALDASRVRYGIRLTVTDESVGRLPESVAVLTQDTRCRGMQVEPCYTGQRGGHGQPHPRQAEAFIAAFLEAFEIAAQAGRSLYYSGARPWTVARAFCRAPAEGLVVTPEGDLMTCYEVHDRRHPLARQFRIGRLTPDAVEIDRAALEAFFAGEEARRAECRGCYCYWHCGGDCATRVASDDHHRLRCDVNRALTRELLAYSIAASGSPLPLRERG